MLKKFFLRFLLIFSTIIASFFLALSLLSLASYQESVLSKPDRYLELNAYWQEKLALETLEFSLGAHYWEGDDLFYASTDNFLANREWMGDSFSGLARFRELPADLRNPVLFVHKRGALAGGNKLYHWKESKKSWTILADGFRAWHTSVEYLDNDILMIGEYGDSIKFFEIDDFSVYQTSHKPDDTRHFHFVRKDPYTGYLYASLGDSHTHFVTGIMVSKDGGKEWDWLHKTRRGFESIHKQPTAVYFLEDKIIFGSDSSPDGMYFYDKSSGEFHQSFVMNPMLKSWFTDIKQHGEVFWAVSRSFGQRPAFGVLWSSVDGSNWQPAQVFDKIPMWLGHSNQGAITIGFFGDVSGVVFQDPGSEMMKIHFRNAPYLSLGLIDNYWLRFSRAWVDFFKSTVRMVHRSP